MSDNAAASVANSYEGPYNAEDQDDIDQIVTEAVDTAAYAASIPDTDLPGEWSDGPKARFPRHAQLPTKLLCRCDAGT